MTQADEKAIATRLNEKLLFIALELLPMAQLNDLGLEVLRISPKLRSHAMINVLQVMTKGNRFFQSIQRDYGPETLSQMLKFVYLEIVPAGEIVFEVESVGYEFFIILKGQVSILINLPNSMSETERERLEEIGCVAQQTSVRRFRSGFKGVPKPSNTLHSKVYHNAEGTFVFFRTNLLKDVNTLSEGASFGEAALDPNKSPLRNATILAKSDCFFAVLDKNNYERIIGERMQQERSRKQSILRNIPHLSQLPSTTIDTLIYFLEPKSYSYRDVVLQQSEKVSKLYIVYEGTVRLVKKINRGAVELLSNKTETEVITVDNI